MTADERVTRLLQKAVFDPLRHDIGDEGLASMVRSRVNVVAGDLTEMPSPPSDLDVIVHSASNVAFDGPVDEVLGDNVGGSTALYESLRESAVDPHVVHVSTSYVAGVCTGVAEEGSLTHTVDYAAELEYAVAARTRAEELSREPDVLNKLLRQAEKEHGRAGRRAVVEAAEASRLDWVRQRLVDHGRTRARSLGWSDAYTFSKALGERVAERLWADAGHRLSIVRPSIIESALRHPYPGWIDGFKVLDPIVGAYARGAIPGFPGNSELVVDVIPVDFVVSAILAAASAPPEPKAARYFQVCSGMRNPLRFSRLTDLITEHFIAHPLPDATEPVAKWTFPSASEVQREMRRREFAVKAADAVVARLPSTARTRKWSTSVLRARRDLALLRRLTAVYRPYAELEVVFDDTRTRELHARVADDAGLPRFDVDDIDWRHYLHDVHLPALPAMMDRGPRRHNGRPGELSDRGDVLAVFDLHSILASSSLWRHHLGVELARRPAVDRPLSLAKMLGTCPRYLIADQRDEADVVRDLMRRYAGCAELELRRIITDTSAQSLLRTVYACAAERIEAHRAAGHHTVLVTGQVDVFVEPLAPLFDDVVASSMDTDGEGRWTGHLAAAPMVNESRAAWLRRYADDRDMTLQASYGYGDCYADRPWLETVGFPNAVNPDLKLHRHARLKRWPVHSWRPNPEQLIAPAHA
jgi:phosphoserine phosphatase/nucleoside-diphosphate-sugar epimerase